MQRISFLSNVELLMLPLTCIYMHYMYFNPTTRQIHARKLEILPVKKWNELTLHCSFSECRACWTTHHHSDRRSDYQSDWLPQSKQGSLPGPVHHNSDPDSSEHILCVWEEICGEWQHRKLHLLHHRDRSAFHLLPHSSYWLLQDPATQVCPNWGRIIWYGALGHCSIWLVYL